MNILLPTNLLHNKIKDTIFQIIKQYNQIKKVSSFC